MADKGFTPYSNEWWLSRLLTQHTAKPARLTGRAQSDSRRFDYKASEWKDYLWAYYTGEPPASMVNDRWSDTTKEFLRLSKNNYPALIVEAVADRLQFLGIRAVDDENDFDGNDAVRRFLSQNGAFIQDSFEFALSLGSGYVFVTNPAPGRKYAVATAEDPRQIEVITDPITGEVVAAMKMYSEADSTVLALYLSGTSNPSEPNGKDRYFTYVHPGMAWDGLDFKPVEWKMDDARCGDLEVQGLGLPIVPITNRRGMSEFEQHLDLIDRITNDIADRLWTVKYQAFIQRAIKGDLPDVDENGEEIDYADMFRADPGALWRLGPNDEIWESKSVSVSEILLPYDKDVKELSAVTRTPLHMFTPDAISGSASGASLATDGAESKARDKIARWSPAMVRIAQLGLAYSGLDYEGEWEAMWGPVENLNMMERAQAASQVGQLVPETGLWLDVLKMPPATVARWQSERADEQLNQAISSAVSATSATAHVESPAPDTQQPDTLPTTEAVQ